MISERPGEVERTKTSRADLSRKVRLVALVFPILALGIGSGAMIFVPRLGLLATALIIGWTQLVGL